MQYLPLLLALEAGGSIALAATLPAELIGATEGFLEQSVTDYLQRSEIQARHEILVHSLDPRLRLNACDQPLEVTLESPSQPLGRVIAVRPEPLHKVAKHGLLDPGQEGKR